MRMAGNMSDLRKDYIASNLRSQINTLEILLGVIEDQDKFEHDYLIESLKRVERGIRRMRNFLAETKVETKIWPFY